MGMDLIAMGHGGVGDGNEVYSAPARWAGIVQPIEVVTVSLSYYHLISSFSSHSVIKN